MAVPFVAGANQDTVTLLVPRVAVGLAGVEGVPGVAAVDAVDAAEVPTPLVAVTVKVYGVPLDNPPTVQLSVERDTGEQVFAPGDDVTV